MCTLKKVLLSLSDFEITFCYILFFQFYEYVYTYYMYLYIMMYVFQKCYETKEEGKKKKVTMKAFY